MPTDRLKGIVRPLSLPNHCLTFSAGIGYYQVFQEKSKTHQFQQKPTRFPTFFLEIRYSGLISPKTTN